jgi:hypothetical protein
VKPEWLVVFVVLEAIGCFFEGVFLYSKKQPIASRTTKTTNHSGFTGVTLSCAQVRLCGIHQ